MILQGFSLGQIGQGIRIGCGDLGPSPYTGAYQRDVSEFW